MSINVNCNVNSEFVTKVLNHYNYLIGTVQCTELQDWVSH